MAPRALVPAAMAAVSILAASAARADMISTEGLAPWEVCGLCHGLDGNSAMARFPRLAGQKPDYIAKQIADFRSGARTNDGGQMAAIVTEVHDGDIPAIAAWFAGQTVAPADAPGDPVGAALFEARGCGDCHLAATPPRGLTVPHVASQHQPYIEKQLRDFRDGGRSNDPDGVMREVASGLTDDEIRALAAHLAALPR